LKSCLHGIAHQSCLLAADDADDDRMRGQYAADLSGISPEVPRIVMPEGS
jgi:hypothetical protein